MNHPPASSRLTDDQVADIVRFLARACLEMERGLRPAEHLRRFMHPSTAHRWPQPGRIGRFGGGPVQPQDLGPPQVSRLTDGHAMAIITTRTEEDRWGALTLQLRAHAGRWHLVDLQRLLPAAHYHARPPTPLSPAVPLDERIGRIQEERQLAAAAHTAATRRLAELAPDDPRYGMAGDLVRSWRRTVSQLDRELVELRTREQNRQSLERGLRR